MPIQLTTPYDPGDADPGVSYTDVEIVGLTFLENDAGTDVLFARGSWDGSSFVRGGLPPMKITIADKPKTDGTDWTTMKAQLPAALTEPIYLGNARLLYTHVLTKGIFAGTPRP